MVLKIAEKKKKKKDKKKKKYTWPSPCWWKTEYCNRMRQPVGTARSLHYANESDDETAQCQLSTPFPSYQLTMTLWTNDDWITNDTHDGHEKSSNKNKDENKNKNCYCYCSCSCCYCSYSYSFWNFRSPLARELLVYMHKDTLYTSESPCILGRIGKTLPSIWQKVE